jgi:hypothetical protein
VRWVKDDVALATTIQKVNIGDVLYEEVIP